MAAAASAPELLTLASHKPIQVTTLAFVSYARPGTRNGFYYSGPHCAIPLVEGYYWGRGGVLLAVIDLEGDKSARAEGTRGWWQKRIHVLQRRAECGSQFSQWCSEK